ncbi:MAG: hypothetical protein ABI377_12625, partial [Devosia sp.]
MRGRDAAKRVLIHVPHGDRGGARGGQSIVKSFGERTGVSMTGALRVHAGLLTRYEFEHSQRQVGRRDFKQQRRLQRRPPPGRLRSEIENLVDFTLGHGFEHGKERTHRLADARGR